MMRQMLVAGGRNFPEKTSEIHEGSLSKRTQCREFAWLVHDPLPAAAATIRSDDSLGFVADSVREIRLIQL